MPTSIQPRQYFPISRLLQDPSDSGTYYLRAKIRNATTGTLLATVSLPNLATRLYASTWQAPADTSGKGLFLTITTEVYTDAAFTTRADTYADEHDTVLVYDQFNYVQSLGSQIAAMIQIPDGEKVNYKKIKDIVSKALSDAETKEIAQPEKVDLSPVLAALTSLRALMEAYNQEDEEEEKPIDFSPVLIALGQAEKHIHDSIEAIPPPEHVDLSPVISEIKQLEVDGMPEKIKEISNVLNELNTKVITSFPDLRDKLKTIIADMKENMMYTMAAERADSQTAQKNAPKNGTVLNSFGKPITR